MNNLPSKIWKRLSIASLYGASQSVVNVIRFISSWLVFQFESAQLWGSFVKATILIQLLSMVANFGQRDYVLKLFSTDPQNIHKNWGANITSRLPLLILSMCTIPYFFDWGIFIFMVLWLAGFYLSQSFLVVVLFERDFRLSLIIELSTALLLPIAIILFRDQLSSAILITAVALGFTLKAISYSIRYYQFLKLRYFKFSRTHLERSFTFFLPTIIGTLQSRVDTYFIAGFLDDTSLAYYHVFMSILRFSYNAVNYTIVPFIKNIYRMSLDSIRKLQVNTFIVAVFFSVVAMSGAKILIENYYQYQLPNSFYIIGAFNIVTFATYVLIINKLFKIGKQKSVSMASFVTLLFQTALSFFIIPTYLLEGAIYVYCAGQTVVTGIFLILDKRSNL